MTLHRSARRRVVAAAALTLAGVRAASAQSAWPDRPVHIVVPFTPGTGMDILARTLAPHLQAAWGQGVVVENRPGASGNIGAAAVAKAPADGATLLMGVNTLIINPALYTNMTYDPLKDLTPIGLCATGSFLLVASTASGIRSVDQLVRQARARPGSLDYASPGIATPHFMAMELFKLRAKVSITHIPFSGTAGAVSAVLAGDVPLMFLPVHVAMAQVRGGRLVALAAAGNRRSSLAPEVPNLRELGFDGVDADLWYAMMGPRGLRRDIVARVESDMRAILARAEVKSALAAQGMEVASGTPEELAALMQRDAARWVAVVKQAGIKAE